jgi:organic radical activating enzyme
MKFQAKLKKYLQEELARIDDIKNRRLVVSSPPSHLYIEPTNICNHDCVMCVPKPKRGKPGYMKLELWQKIVDNMAANGFMPPTTMIGRGEPLLHKDIAKMVAYGSKRDIPCYIITNGAMLTEDMARSLLDAGVKKIQISLHALTKDVHAQVTRRKTYDQVIANVKKLIEIKEKEHYTGCHVAVMSCTCELNKHEVEEFKKYWTPLVDRCFVTELYSMQGDSGLAGEATSSAGRFMQGVKHPGCVNPYYFLIIRYHGGINACGYDWQETMTVGNAADPDYDLMKVFNGEMMQEMRKSMVTGDFSFCKKHDYPCETCEWAFDPDAFRGLDSYADNLPDVFSRIYAGALRD